ncbi:MAG: AmmeMemoRadiSam system protein A, partial [Bacteroidota bacterium]|nr:AmmeMemoRadiSam system protein A [Bacteroidota bacterium]
DRTICQQIAKALKPWLNEENLFIISSDFSHYPSYADAQRIDSRTKDAILSNDPEKLLKTLWNNAEARIPRLATSLCGWTSVLTLLYMTNHEKSLSYKAINYMNSGDSELYGEKDRVVGYWAIAVTEKVTGDIEETTSGTANGTANGTASETINKAAGKTADEEKHPTSETGTAEAPFNLTEADKAQLLSIARGSLEACVRGNTLPKIDATNVSRVLKTNCGAFVTLHIHGNLRGCIGRLTGNLPLYKIVQEMAVAAALHDYRFMPVSPDELKQIDIELSVLSPLKKIDDVAEIELGKHGVLIEKNRHSGVFLPQVATETHWTLDEFLGHCARDKAGLEWDEWKTANLYIYTATVFGDS